MKNTAVLLLISGLILLACGGGEEPASQPDGTDTGTVTEDQDVTVEETPVETAPPPLYPEGTLDPSLITAETPVTAAALYQAFYAWDGKKITLEGYPYIMYMKDTMVVDDEIELIAELGSRDVLATALFTDSCGETVWADQLVTVSGTIEYSWTGDIAIVDAVIESDAPPAEQDIITSPYIYDGNTPILVAEFYEMFNVWLGKEVIVEGYYHSTTTSSSSYGSSIRVDLADPDDTYSKYVACEMAAEIPEETNAVMIENRAGTQIRGTIEDESFSMVGLVNCELINR
ncbi:MAG: hypothetical protein ABFR50_00960 [Candidatus Fermentibacteria bacterium]